MEPADIAADNFDRHIRRNSYPGRGLVIGRSEQGFRLVYWIMGRSEHSRNRAFEAEGTTLRTIPLDASKVEDPSLIIYEAMLELPGVQLVTNGDQTRTISDAIEAGGSFEAALGTREREPDAPNYTPRISGMIDFRNGEPQIALNILKANPLDPASTDRTTFRPAPPPRGFGLCITTYIGDGKPLPSFAGDPLLLPCAGDPEETLTHYWDGLDDDNRIAVAVKEISADGSCAQLLVRNR